MLICGIFIISKIIFSLNFFSYHPNQKSILKESTLWTISKTPQSLIIFYPCMSKLCDPLKSPKSFLYEGHYNLSWSRTRSKGRGVDCQWNKKRRLGSATKLSLSAFLDASFGENLWRFLSGVDQHHVPVVAYKLPIRPVPSRYSSKWSEDDKRIT